jgi:hypothetical protein
VFHFTYIIIVGINLLNNAKFNSKYDTRYFQNLKELKKLHGKIILYFARPTNIHVHLRKLRQTLKTAPHWGTFYGYFK